MAERVEQKPRLVKDQAGLCAVHGHLAAAPKGAERASDFQNITLSNQSQDPVYNFPECQPGQKGRTGPRAQRAGGPRQGREKRGPERGEAPTGLGLPGAPSGGGRAGGGRGEPHHTQRVARLGAAQRNPSSAEVEAAQPETMAPLGDRSPPAKHRSGSRPEVGAAAPRSGGGTGHKRAGYMPRDAQARSGRPRPPPSEGKQTRRGCDTASRARAGGSPAAAAQCRCG